MRRSRAHRQLREGSGDRRFDLNLAPLCEIGRRRDGLNLACYNEADRASGDCTVTPILASQQESKAGTDNTKLVTRLSAATATTVAAGVNPHRFTIEFDLSNSQIKFYLDGVLAATSATVLPAGSQLLRWRMAATRLEGVDKSAEAGWICIEADR